MEGEDMDEAQASGNEQQQPPVTRDEEVMDDKSEDEAGADKAEPSADEVTEMNQWQHTPLYIFCFYFVLGRGAKYCDE